MVLMNVCLSCTLEKQPSLTFVGPVGTADDRGFQVFKFLDDRGFVYLASTRYTDEPKQDVYQTLLHWEFPVPAVYKPPRGEEVQLYTSSWSIYGDVRSSVVVGEKYYEPKHTCTFLLYKGGAFRELTKRDSEMKQLLDQAADIVEESKDGDGWYHIGNHLTRHRSDTAVYEVVSQIAGAVYDVKLRISQTMRQAVQPEENEAGEAL